MHGSLNHIDLTRGFGMEPGNVRLLSTTTLSTSKAINNNKNKKTFKNIYSIYKKKITKHANTSESSVDGMMLFDYHRFSYQK